MNQSMTYEEFQARVGSVILTENGNCPVTPVVQMLQGKWKLQIIYELCIQSPMRFGELKKMLTRLLRIQLLPGRKACWVDDRLCNRFKAPGPENAVRVQQAVRDYLASCAKTLLYRAEGAPLPDERL